MRLGRPRLLNVLQCADLWRRYRAGESILAIERALGGSATAIHLASWQVARRRATICTMDECTSSQCPYCGEAVELLIDGGGGPHQEYVEDCPVCCRPWQVEASLESDDTWHVELRTSDE